MVGFCFQTDDAFLLLDVDRKGGRLYTYYRVIDDAIDEEGNIRHEFAHPRRVRSLIDVPLQDIGFSDAFKKVTKVLAVSDETGFVHVAPTAITRGMIVLVLTRVLFLRMNP